jgi:CSLREA domain-containing protein
MHVKPIESESTYLAAGTERNRSARRATLGTCWKLLGACAMFFSCMLLARAGHASTFTVTTEEDTYEQGDGVCSLREAVDTARFNDCWEDCGCGSPDDPSNSIPSDIVELGPGKTYTVGSQLDISDSLLIIARGEDPATIRAADSEAEFLGFVAHDCVGGSVLHSIRLANFRQTALSVGPGCDLTAFNVTLDGNRGIFITQTGSILARSGSIVRLVKVVATNNTANKGGGILVDNGATVVLSQSTIFRNTAQQYGGGVYVMGTLACYNSVISHNTADHEGGGLSIAVTLGGRISAFENCFVQSNNAALHPDIHVF